MAGLAPLNLKLSQLYPVAEGHRIKTCGNPDCSYFGQPLTDRADSQIQMEGKACRSYAGAAQADRDAPAREALLRKSADGRGSLSPDGFIPRLSWQECRWRCNRLGRRCVPEPPRPVDQSPVPPAACPAGSNNASSSRRGLGGGIRSSSARVPGPDTSMRATHRFRRRHRR